MSVSSLVNRIGRRFGVEILRYRPHNVFALRRARLISSLDVDLLFDVGANVGQYGREVRTLGYCGRIVSFEPLGDAFEALRLRTEKDARWECRHAAIGDQLETVKLYRSGNSVSSSILPMQAWHLKAAPASKYVGYETVDALPLRGILDEYLADAKKVWLKADVQGYESKVLDGCGDRLSVFAAVELELGFVEAYRGESLFADQLERLRRAGFRIVSIGNGLTDERTGVVIQVDAIFVNLNLMPSLGVESAAATSNDAFFV